MLRFLSLLLALGSFVPGVRALDPPGTGASTRPAEQPPAVSQDVRAPHGAQAQQAAPEQPAPEQPAPESTAGAPEDPAQQARALFERGLEYSAQERWGEALEYFRRSRARVDRPSSAFNMAVAQLRLGRPSAALRSLGDYLRLSDPELEAERRAEARRLLELAMAAIARVEVQLSPAHAQLEVDGVPVAGEGAVRELSLDPGKHRLEASAEGYHRGVLELSLLDGERVQRALSLEAKPEPVVVVQPAPTPQPAPSAAPAAALTPTQRDAGDAGGGLLHEPLFWVAVGAVAVAAGVGIALALDDGDDPMTGGNTGVVLQALGR